MARLSVDQGSPGLATVTALCSCGSGICVPRAELVLLCSSVERQVHTTQSPAVLEC